MNNCIIDIETTGLEKEEHRIVSIAGFCPETDNSFCFLEKEEKVILEKYFEFIVNNNVRNIITYCGDSFDIPFINFRSFINRVKIQKLISIDLMKVIHSFFVCYDKSKLKLKLSEIAKILDLNIKTSNGSTVPDLFYAGEFDKIKEHNEEDVFITNELYKRCKECNLI